MESQLEALIAQQASTQHSHVTRAQMIDLGASYQGIERLIRRSRLEQVGWRTFRMGGVPRTWMGDVMAACLDIGATASHRTAARLHPLEGFARFQPIEVVRVDGKHNSGSPLAIVHRTTNLPADDIVMVQGIPCTGVARTILGLSALVDCVSDEKVRNAVDAAVRDGLASDSWLCWHLAHRRCRGRNGVIRMEGILQQRLGLGPTESWLERAFIDLLQDAGLPLPTVQRRVRAQGINIARVDCCYDADLIAIELKGYNHHSTRQQLIADAARENELQIAGYRLLQFTYDHVVRRPGYVLDTVRRALAGPRLAKAG